MVVQIINTGIPTAGENYQLTCAVLGAENLNPTITYQWTKNNIQMQIKSNSETLSFTPLRLSDAANYACTVTIASSYLTGDISVMNFQEVTVQSEHNYVIPSTLLIFSRSIFLLHF